MPVCIDYQTVTLLNVEDFGICSIFERSWHDVKVFLSLTISIKDWQFAQNIPDMVYRNLF